MSNDHLQEACGWSFSLDIIVHIHLYAILLSYFRNMAQRLRDEAKFPTRLHKNKCPANIQSQVKSSTHGRFKNKSNIFGYDGVPSPVTGSHPVTHEKPSVPQPGFFPVTISVRTSGC
jgi:hypothetical protein